jgi:hypothetical protein
MQELGGVKALLPTDFRGPLVGQLAQSKDQVDTMGAQGEELTNVNKTLDKSSNLISDISSL